MKGTVGRKGLSRGTHVANRNPHTGTNSWDIEGKVLSINFNPLIFIQWTPLLSPPFPFPSFPRSPVPAQLDGGKKTEGRAGCKCVFVCVNERKKKGLIVK